MDTIALRCDPALPLKLAEPARKSNLIQCPLLAQSGHRRVHCTCLLLTQKRTSLCRYSEAKFQLQRSGHMERWLQNSPSLYRRRLSMNGADRADRILLSFRGFFRTADIPSCSAHVRFSG